MKDFKRMDKLHPIKWSPDKIARLWDYYANNPSYASQYFSSHSGIYILGQCRKYISFKDKDVLDFGCGRGHLIGYLLGMGTRRVWGMDFSEESFNAVNNKFSGRKNFAGAVHIRDFPSSLKDDSIDISILVEVVEHVDDSGLDLILREIYRILRPGGWVVITTPLREDLEASKTVCPECGCIFHRWQHLR
ncbi:MAG: methyltransferase domain-containing protein, partial [Candidatus Omnitrophica bacterium]|nr:methyltransferase domain-containing protein [Candidatus Omnitrophota bacterium]MBD3269239.1 methyltransferase domain-containing protein [Candidatus Omnitrophota bacterium]